MEDEKKSILKPPQTSQQAHAFGPCAAVWGGCVWMCTSRAMSAHSVTPFQLPFSHY